MSRASRASRAPRAPRADAEPVDPAAPRGGRGRRGRRGRGHHFVPVEDVPGPGLGARAREAVAFLVIGGSLFALLSLGTFDASTLDADEIARGDLRNLGGVVGYHLADAMTFVLGLAAWVLFLFGLLYGVLLFVGRQVDRLVLKVLGVVVLAAMLSLMLAGADGEADPARLSPYGPGGMFGAHLSPKLYHAFGGSGRILLLLFGALVSLLLATEWLFSTLLIRVAGRVENAWRSFRAPRRLVPAHAPGGALGADFGDDEADAPTDPASLAAGEVAERWRIRFWPKRRVPGGGAAGAGTIAAGPDDGPIAGPIAEPVVEAIEAARSAEVGGAAGGVAVADAEDPIERPAAEAADAGPETVTEAGAGTERAAPPPRARRPLLVRNQRRRRKRRAGRGRPKQPELPFAEPYPFPPVDLFREPELGDRVSAQQQLDANKTAIEQRLASFKVDAEVVAASVGPAVTQYEVRVGEGIRVGKIVSFEADLAAALRAVSVRVVAPIPGKDTVGIEVPNVERQTVVMRELLEQFGRAEDLAIPLFLGKDVAGEAIIEDLARMPHMLIAGTTGSGKSVCINAILLSILMTRTPQQVRLILIDPKMVELQNYRRIPHLACDVVTNMKKAPQVLEWAVDEMERRYALLSAVGVNHIVSYNRLGQDELEARLGRPVDPADVYLPYQVLVIDELADLMAVAQKDIEDSIQRLAQKSRSVGLHVILATQRPSTDVITGIIKANLPAQIAFKVSRKIDSRVILDANGAEKLLGHGDMLYVAPSSHYLMRAQGTFVSEEEIQRVVRYLEEHGPKPSFIPDLAQKETASRRRSRDRDDMYEAAVDVVLGQQRGSATLLQRAMAVGYTRATRLLEMMEEDGLVGPFVGSKSREVMLTIEQYQEREAAIAAELGEAEDGGHDLDIEDEGGVAYDEVDDLDEADEADEVDEVDGDEVDGEEDGAAAARALPGEGWADDLDAAEAQAEGEDEDDRR